MGEHLPNARFYDPRRYYLFVITHRMGGLSNAISKVDPGLLMQAEHIKPLELLTYLCVPLCVGMFPHIFSHF